MASISTDGKGRRTIQFVGADGKRRSIRLGRVELRLVDEWKRKVEMIDNAKRMNVSLAAELADWIGGLSDDLHGKLPPWDWWKQGRRRHWRK